MNDIQLKKSMLREARMGSFYTKNIWPVQRYFVRSSLYKRCKNCILNEKYCEINSRTGLCKLCEDQTDSQVSSNDSLLMTEELNELILKSIKDNPQSQFHALLLFSGGKDSCYMALRMIREHPDLRVLFLSFDNCFMSPFALENISASISRLGASHMWIRPPESMMKKMFGFALLRDNPNERMGLLDFLDGELISDIARNIAYKMNIPLIFMGLSTEQVEKIIDLDSYVRPYEEEGRPRTHIRNISLNEVFDEDEKKWWWQGANANSKPAQFLFPLYAWDVGETEIKQEVTRSGVLKGATLEPRLTNHTLILPMIITDYIRKGYFTYEPEFAEMIRHNRAKREDWIDIFELMEYASKTGKLLPPSFDKTLRRLDLDRRVLNIPNAV